MVDVEGTRTFDNTMMPLADVGNLLGQTFGRYGFLGYVSPDSGLRDVARTQEETLNKYGVDLGFREDIYEAVKSYSETDEAVITSYSIHYTKLYE